MLWCNRARNAVKKSLQALAQLTNDMLSLFFPTTLDMLYTQLLHDPRLRLEFGAPKRLWSPSMLTARFTECDKSWCDNQWPLVCSCWQCRLAVTTKKCGGQALSSYNWFWVSSKLAWSLVLPNQFELMTESLRVRTELIMMWSRVEAEPSCQKTSSMELTFSLQSCRNTT